MYFVLLGKYCFEKKFIYVLMFYCKVVNFNNNKNIFLLVIVKFDKLDDVRVDWL